MEGTRCAEENCTVHDFLPFFCCRCQQEYCLEHRSRFTHKCIAESEEADPSEQQQQSKSHMPSVKEMFKAVESRFLGTGTAAAPDHRLPIKTARETRPSSASEQRISRLGRRQDPVAAQTRRMLMKKHAQGNQAVAQDKRIYFAAVLASAPENAPPLGYYFFASYISLGEMLRELKRMLPTIPGLADENTALCVHTQDSEDWRRWDRKELLESVLGAFETLYVQCRDLGEVVAAQNELEQARARCASPPTSASGRQTLAKGALAWYHRTSPGPASLEVAIENRIPLVLVKVIGVHLDDFPNIYYTIERCRTETPHSLGNDPASIDFQGERQTDSQRLFPVPVTAATAPAQPAGSPLSPPPPSQANDLANRLEQELTAGDGPTWTMTLQHRTNVFRIAARPHSKLSTLRELVALRLGIPYHAIKLICKGSTLKGDKHTLKDMRLGDQSRIMVVG